MNNVCLSCRRIHDTNHFHRNLRCIRTNLNLNLMSCCSRNCCKLRRRWNQFSHDIHFIHESSVFPSKRSRSRQLFRSWCRNWSSCSIDSNDLSSGSWGSFNSFDLGTDFRPSFSCSRHCFPRTICLLFRRVSDTDSLLQTSLLSMLFHRRRKSLSGMIGGRGGSVCRRN